jgi:hypothetical protein
MATETEEVLALARTLDRSLAGERVRGSGGNPKLFDIDGNRVGRGLAAWLARLAELEAERVVAVPTHWPGLPAGTGRGAMRRWTLVALPCGVAWTRRARPGGWQEGAPSTPHPIPGRAEAEASLAAAIEGLAGRLDVEGRSGPAGTLRHYGAVVRGAEPSPEWVQEQAARVQPAGSTEPLARALYCETILGGGALADLLLEGSDSELGEAARALSHAVDAAIAAAVASRN